MRLVVATVIRRQGAEKVAETGRSKTANGMRLAGDKPTGAGQNRITSDNGISFGFESESVHGDMNRVRVSYGIDSSGYVH